MFNKIKKQKRGFSLVELMVVVAIMGTLSAIAIPAYNNYRQSAKKNAYRTDLTSLHKSWLAFGVELDSFCERDTSPENASIAAVGMASLTTSKLYGQRGACVATTQCSGTEQSTITSASTQAACNNVSGLTTLGCAASWDSSAGNGPGKHNFIGFQDATTACSNIASNTDVQVLGSNTSGTPTIPDGDCDLTVTSYNMGVYGHLSGETFYGVSMNNNGVLSEENESPISGAQANSNCS